MAEFFHLFGRQGRLPVPALVLAAAASALFITGAAWLLVGCGGFQAEIDATTSVATLSGEDLSGPCVYDLYLPIKTEPQKGVFVVYQRGDSAVVFNSLQVREMAAQIDFAMVFAHQCNAASYGDIQSDPAKGPGRALFTALNQFASATRHPELATANVILDGFSAAGVLAAEMSSFAPDRTMGVIAYAAGSAHYDIQTFAPAAAALKVPSLFLDNAQDTASGTYRSLVYFTNGRLAGARWGFGVQNGVGHCCNATTIPMILPWISAVANPATAEVPLSSGLASFVCSPDGVIDAQNDQDCSITSASLGSSTTQGETTAWLPGTAALKEWLAWVQNSRASATSVGRPSLKSLSGCIPSQRSGKHAIQRPRYRLVEGPYTG